MPKLLLFVQKSNPILRKVIPKETDLNDPTLLETIQDMCYSILPTQLKAAEAAFESAAGMAANQWGLSRRVFIFTPDGSGEGNRMDVMINPSYEPYFEAPLKEPKMVAAYEGCFSVPLATGIVNRFESIVARYFNMKGEKVEQILHGWEARVFQHETDHLDGKLYDGRLDHFDGPECFERIVFKDMDEMNQYWVDKVKPSRKGDV